MELRFILEMWEIQLVEQDLDRHTPVRISSHG